jgi:hypothetical protein
MRHQAHANAAAAKSKIKPKPGAAARNSKGRMNQEVGNP